MFLGARVGLGEALAGPLLLGGLRGVETRSVSRLRFRTSIRSITFGRDGAAVPALFGSSARFSRNLASNTVR